MKPRAILFILLASLLAGASGAGALILIDRRTAYRSPLSAREEAETPRGRGLADLAEWRREQEAAVARRRQLLATLDTAKMVVLGEEIVRGRGLCTTCHKIDGQGTGIQGPDLGGVGARAAARVPGLGPLEYLVQSLYTPDAYVVEGFRPAMTRVDGPPFHLDDLEVRLVVAYLQSLGGTPTVTPDSPLRPGAGS